MKKRILLGLAVLCAASVWAADKVQPLDVKLGLWETTYTTETSGLPPIPPEVLARMTPEQRAKMEQMMPQQGGQGPRTETRKKCMTKEDLDKASMLGDDDKACTKTIISSTPRKLEGKMECTHGGGKQTGTFHIEAVDSSNVKGAVQMVMNGGGNTMTVNSTFTSKYLGPACGTTK